MTAADLGDLTLEYDSHGDGEPLVLIMGLATQMIAWSQPFVDRLASHGYRVIRFDNRDIGMSSKTQGLPPARTVVMKSFAGGRFSASDYVLSDMADDTARLLDHLDVSSAHIVGASMGAMIAQELAINHPGKVRSLTSIMSTTGSRRYGRVAPSLVPELRRTMFAPPPTSKAEIIERGVLALKQIAGPHYSEDDVRAMVVESAERSTDVLGRVRQLLAINASPDRTPGLRQLTVPTLVIHGMLDRLVSMSGGIATARAVPGSRLLLFPDMAHDLPIPRRDEIADAIHTNAQRAS
ncbi:MAG: alpha/beta hydrolase [Nostocoides sp.]